MATTDITLVYCNTSADPIECVYEYPLEKATLLSQLILRIGEKTITAVVDKKDDAKLQYQEAIKAKNTAVLAER